jgi:hypothetical protein
VKSIRLKFPAKERTLFYLVLTTHDPTGALTLNEILDDAEYREWELRKQRRTARQNALQQSLFDVAEYDQDVGPIANESDPQAVAEIIYSYCAGLKMQYRDVLRYFVDLPFYHSDIRQAMAVLKKQGLVFYQELANKETVTFK